MGNRRVHRLHATQVEMNLRGDNEIRELSCEEPKGREDHRDQQKCWDHTNKDIGNNQPVPQTPQKFRLEPSKGQNRKERDGNKAKETDPPSQTGSCRNFQNENQFLQQEQNQGQSQGVPSAPSHSRGGPQSPPADSVTQE